MSDEQLSIETGLTLRKTSTPEYLESLTNSQAGRWASVTNSQAGRWACAFVFFLGEKNGGKDGGGAARFFSF